MKPTKIEGETRDLGPPPGWDDSQCGRLSIRDEQDPDIGDQMVSQWVPDDEERALLAAGAHIRLSICGTMHPPVMISVVGP